MKTAKPLSLESKDVEALWYYAITGSRKNAAKALMKAESTVKNQLQRINKRLKSESTLHSFALLVADGIFTREMLQRTLREDQGI
jgi:DNA-binding CsgD family transcriptional regulator